MENQLVEINLKNVLLLRNLFAKQTDLKKYVSYCTINNFIQWFEKGLNNENVKFYSLNGDFSDGTFVLIVKDQSYAYADTLNENHENLICLLQLLDYSKGYLFLDTRAELQSSITNAIQGINDQIEMIDSALLLYLPKEKALEYDVSLPDGIDLKPITEENDFQKVNSVWRHRFPGSLQFLKRMAKYNVNIGAFKEDGTLVAWIFRYPNGIMGVLQTDESCRCSGYGSLVFKQLSKKIAEMGDNLLFTINLDNHVSRNIVTKLGFVIIGEVDWIKTKSDKNEATKQQLQHKL